MAFSSFSAATTCYYRCYLVDHVSYYGMMSDRSLLLLLHWCRFLPTFLTSSASSSGHRSKGTPPEHLLYLLCSFEAHSAESGICATANNLHWHAPVGAGRRQDVVDKGKDNVQIVLSLLSFSSHNMGASGKGSAHIHHCYQRRNNLAESRIQDKTG